MSARDELNAGKVLAELDDARSKFADIHSPHEGLAVIHEEFIELQRLVYSNEGAGLKARAEAMQLAAMAIRYMSDLT